MAQQTAVDWLVKEFGLEEYKSSVEIAKQMEKNQIMNAYWNGTTDMDKFDALTYADKFYNEYYSQ